MTASGDTWTLRAARPPSTRPPAGNRAELADMLGIAVTEIAGEPLWGEHRRRATRDSARDRRGGARRATVPS